MPLFVVIVCSEVRVPAWWLGTGIELFVTGPFCKSWAILDAGLSLADVKDFIGANRLGGMVHGGTAAA